MNATQILIVQVTLFAEQIIVALDFQGTLIVAWKVNAKNSNYSIHILKESKWNKQVTKCTKTRTTIDKYTSIRYIQILKWIIYYTTLIRQIFA